MAVKAFTGLRVTRDRVDSVMRAIGNTDQTRVLVGIPADEALRQPEPGEKSEPPNNAMLGYIHEFGSPAANIPPRPFLIPGIESAWPRIAKTYADAMRAIMAGQPVDMNVIHHRVGLIAQAAVRQKITEGPFELLADATLAKRRAKGRTGTRPLIDTGQLRNAINYVLRRKGAAE